MSRPVEDSNTVLTCQRAEGPDASVILAKLHHDIFAREDGEHAWSEDAFAAFFEQPGRYASILSAAGTPTGLALVQWGCDQADLVTFGILPRYRRKGLARYFIANIADDLVSAGVKTLFLETRSNNHAACRLYMSAGFQMIGRRKDYYKLQNGKREDALQFSLCLNSLT